VFRAISDDTICAIEKDYAFEASRVYLRNDN
jgi:hypothetical protein